MSFWKITSWFSSHDSAHTDHAHKGIDIAMPMDTPVHSVSSGIVERITHEGNQSFGNAIWLKCPDGYRVVYGHLDQTFVKLGEHIYKSEVIALSGNSGHSTGPHLHIGVMDTHGQWVDPNLHFNFANSWKSWEDDHISNPITNIVEDVIWRVGSDIGHWIAHIIAPVALVVCTVFILLSIAGVEKAPQRAFTWGLVASIAYGSVGRI